MRYQKAKLLISQYLKDYLESKNFSISYFDAYSFVISGKINNVTCILSSSKYNMPHGISYSAVSSALQLFEVEKIVFPIVLKNHLWDSSSEPSDYSLTIGDHGNEIGKISFRQKLRNFEIKEEDDIAHFCSLLKDYLETYAFPWLTKYSSIEAVNELINELSMQDILDWFAGPFPTQFYRAIIITEHCNNRSKTLEIQTEILRHFELCKLDSFYASEVIEQYEQSYKDFCGILKI